MKNLTVYSFIILVISVHSCFIIESPKPILPITNTPKIDWQEMEFFDFIDFSINPIQQKVLFLNTISEKNIKFMTDKIMND